MRQSCVLLLAWTLAICGAAHAPITVRCRGTARHRSRPKFSVEVLSRGHNGGQNGVFFCASFM
jgi:hypothetical protein